MNRSKLLLLVAMPLAFAACADNEAEVEPGADVAVVPVTTPAPGMGTDMMMGSNMAGMEQMVNMAAVGNSGVSGQATLNPQGSQTQVMLTLNGLAPNSAHAGHIHMGTCASLGNVVQPLPEVTADASGSGMVSETVPLDPATVLNGQHIIAYHQDPGENHGATIVCGSIPQMSM